MRGYEHRLRAGVDSRPELGLTAAGLQKGGLQKIFREKLSGASRERPEFQNGSAAPRR
jgi:hypothetical protein